MIFPQIAIVLLPVAAGCGWYFRGRSQKNIDSELEHPTREYYFSGLNHIINEEADKAVDAFVKLIEVDADTVETHLALGNLFRRRGEVDRAIRIHQNVVFRSEISESIRNTAYTALAHDYLKAGVLDRAEEVCLHLIKVGVDTDDILRLLLKIYQKERQWKKAINTAKRLKLSASCSDVADISHYYAELADDMYELGQYDQVHLYLQHALKVDASNVRVNFLLSRMHINKGHYEEVFDCCEKVECRSYSLLSYILPRLLDRKDKMGSELQLKLNTYINDAIIANPFLFLLLSVADSFDMAIIHDRTLDIVFANIKNDNSIERIHYFLCFQQLNSHGDSRLQAIHLRDYLNKLIRGGLFHQCCFCGFKTNDLFWCCPGCDRWETATKRQLLLSLNDGNGDAVDVM
jgi:lipopolysaccharide assembly protein B